MAVMNISHQTLEPDIALVRLDGRLDAETSQHLRTTLQQLLETNQLKIIIDLQKVPFIDSSGLAALVSGLRLAREKKGSIILSGAQSQAMLVFRLTMFDRVFPIHSTLEEAKRSLL
jgi:anti-sigma B factor antagonist